MSNISSFKYTITESEIDHINKKFKELILSNGFLTNGKYCQQLEEEFSTYINSGHAISCNTGTSALELIYRALNLSKCDVLVPTTTFTATITPLLNLQTTPIFYDCDNDLAFDFQSILDNITKNTKAIVITHIGGFINPQINELVDYCRDKNIYLIEDCAHAHGSSFQGKKAGTFGVAGAFSLFSTKVMTCGEGGIVTTSNKDLCENMKLIRDHGQHADNVINSIGYNFRMSEIHALIAISQLQKLDTMIAKRTQIESKYDLELHRLKSFERIQQHNEVSSSLYKYTLLASPIIDVQRLYATAKAEFGIALAGITYPIPCHQQLIFKNKSQQDLKRSEDLSKRIVCLPIYPGLKDQEIERIITFLSSF